MEVGLPLSQPVRLTAPLTRGAFGVWKSDYPSGRNQRFRPAPLTRGAFGRMEVEGDCQKVNWPEAKRGHPGVRPVCELVSQ